MKPWCVILFLAVSLTMVTIAGADESSATGDDTPSGENSTPLPKHRITYENLLVVRYNSLGLEDMLDIRYRLRLYKRSDILYRDAHIGLGFTPSISPAQARIGPSLVIKPLAVLTLTVGYHYSIWFGNFDFLQSYTSPRAPYSDSDLDREDKNGRSYATTGHEAHLGVNLIAKVGPIVISNDLNAFYHDQDLRAGDTAFYEARYDMMVRDRGWLLSNDTNLLYLTDFGFIAGLTHSLVHAFYKDDDFLESEPTTNPNGPLLYLGPLAAYIFYDKPERLFNEPTLIFLVTWYLKHRFRTGADVPQAVPCLMLGFSFNGELWHPGS